MQKRVITGVIVIFLALAAQDRFFSGNTGDFVGTTKSPVFPTVSVRKPDIHLVTRVIDGDTIVVLVNGVSEKVRLIGVDTPETVDPRKVVQCFGEESSVFVKSLLENKAVRLEADASQDDRDKYGRLLRYVFLEDDTLVNQKIIIEGYGYEYTYRTPYKYQTDFKNAERRAREAQKGLWANGACGLQNTK